MYIETWNKFSCPFCKSINWNCAGDVSDLTAFDDEGCICWNCEKGFYFDEYSTSGNSEYNYFNKGLKEPN